MPSISDEFLELICDESGSLRPIEYQSPSESALGETAEGEQEDFVLSHRAC